MEHKIDNSVRFKEIDATVRKYMYIEQDVDDLSCLVDMLIEVVKAQEALITKLREDMDELKGADSTI